jgi:ribosomal protein S18 acetylase RimI-like enzyme
MAALDSVTTRICGRAKSGGLRPFDIGRDLRPVAELIAEAFTNELDPRGKAALREMRFLSHLSGLLKLLSRGTGEFEDVFSGYVWEEEGKIVGNITVQRADKFGNRWQIANVAVAPQFRGRGIARVLMARALEHVEESHGRWAVLQVYDKNTVARNLYDRMGFEVVGGQMDLRLNRLLPLEEYPHMPGGVGPFSAHDWLPLFELANNQHSAQLQWWRPLRRVDFQVPFEHRVAEGFLRLVGKNRIYRRAVHSMRRFEAALILTAQRWRGAHKLELWARPDAYGRYEEALLQWALATLQEYPRMPVTTTLSTDHAQGIHAFRRAGFEPVQTLLTMRREVG